MRYFDLLEALGQPRCAVCSLLLRDAARYLDALLYEYVNDRDSHQAVRAGRGLCAMHSAQLPGIRGRSLGVAILLNAALDEIRQIEARHTPAVGLSRLRGKMPLSKLAGSLEPDGPCAACAYLDGCEDTCVDMVAANLHDGRLRDALANSGGLCLPHVRRVLNAVSNATQAAEFLEIQRGIWARLQTELETFIRKSDVHNAAGETMGAEGDSWQRAIMALAGDPGIFGLRR